MKFSEVQLYLFNQYLTYLDELNSREEVTTNMKSYLRGVNTNIVTFGSQWLELYYADKNDYNYKKIFVKPKRNENDTLSFIIKDEL